ncbi:hypothetical protein BJV78DRAFT_1263232 [Lactifluus subvellereus]|nr:hypothetical protein BJV78DRAFT_1263232 [Lactifluus subvellereus]
MPSRSTPLSSSQSPARIVRRASHAMVPEAWSFPLRWRRRHGSTNFPNSTSTCTITLCASASLAMT